MELIRILEALERYSEETVAYKLDATFAHAVTEAYQLLQDLGEKLADTEARVAELITRDRWVSVNEKLPEEDDRVPIYDDGRMKATTVLAYTVYGRIIPKNRLMVRVVGNEYLDTQATDGWVWASGSEDVTHWKPMPGKPKEE